MEREGSREAERITQSFACSPALYVKFFQAFCCASCLSAGQNCNGAMWSHTRQNWSQPTAASSSSQRQDRVLGLRISQIKSVPTHKASQSSCTFSMEQLCAGWVFCQVSLQTGRVHTRPSFKPAWSEESKQNKLPSAGMVAGEALPWLGALGCM